LPSERSGWTAGGLEVQGRYVRTNGIRLHLVEAGPKNGPPVVLLHGFPDFSYGWRRQIPALAEAGHRVIAPDLRGFNLSDKPRGIRSYELRQVTDDVCGLIDALELGPVDLVGHDWGGWISWHLAAWQPHLLRRLAILNMPHPAVMRRFLTHDLEQLRRSWYVFALQLPWLPEALLRASRMRPLVRALGFGSRGTLHSADEAEYRRAWSQPGAITAMINWYRAGRREFRRPKDHLRIFTPALLVWGMRDVALSHRMARPSMDYCEKGRLVLIPDASHWLHWEASEEINSLLVGFFEG